MADAQVYECSKCGKTVELSADEAKAPECCGL